MQSLKIKAEVGQDHTMTAHLPKNIAAGEHSSFPRSSVGMQAATLQRCGAATAEAWVYGTLERL